MNNMNNHHAPTDNIEGKRKDKDRVPQPCTHSPDDWQNKLEPVADPDSPVLVAVLTSRRDFAIARDLGWYRIPLQRGPNRVGADYLAFYQTKAFAQEGWAINYYAPVRRFRIARRVELLPAEADHPRAHQQYYKVEIGPLQRLPQPIPSRHLRRITFIPTTLGRLLSAREINDLWWRDDRQERLWRALREAGLSAEYRTMRGQPPISSTVDITIFCRHGYIAILCVEEDGGTGADLREPGLLRYDDDIPTMSWYVLCFSPEQLQNQLAQCVAEVEHLVQELGGERNA
jgi:hypothetical protein